MNSQQDMKTAKETIGKHTGVTGVIGENAVRDEQTKDGADAFERDKMYKTSYGTPVDEDK